MMQSMEPDCPDPFRPILENPAFRSQMGPGGLEPPTSPLSGVRSSQLSYEPGKVTALCKQAIATHLGGPIIHTTSQKSR